MKHKLLVVLFALIFQFVAHAQNEVHSQYCTRITNQIDKKNTQGKGLSPSLYTQNYDLKYYRFDWYIDPSVWYIKGTVTTYFQIIGKNQSSIGFDFTSNLVVDSIMWRGQKINFKQSGSYQLDVNFPSPLPENALDSISITYHGEPPTSGFGSFIQDQHAGVPVLWTLSEPFGAQDWWPCKNGLEDKIDSIDVYVTTPQQYRAASNGVLAQEYSAEEGLKTYHWKHRHAIAPYLVAIAVTNYEVYTDDVRLSDGKIMPMLNYVYPESINRAKIGTANNVKALQFFDSLFVSYPFKDEKYGHAQFNWGGGMEHQTMSFVVNFDWGLLAHELAHQWFGDFVTCKSWQDIWLNEGFATYLDGLSRERYPQFQNDWYNWKLGTLRSIISQPGGSVKVADPSNVNSIFNSRLSYNKGSFLVHMLRWKLGDDIFFKGIRKYLNTHQYSTVTTNDLKVALEEVSGQDLTSYFKNWYEGQGYPIYDIKWTNKNGKLIIRINQTTSHTSVKFFDMPLPFDVVGNGQTKKIRVENTENGQTFEIPIDFDIDYISFDPDIWLISTSKVTYDDGLVSATNDLTSNTILKPNPVQDILTIISENGEWKTYNIISTDGRTILSGDCTNTETVISVAHIGSGPYFIQLNGKDNNSKILKWVKL
jgi:aminopeptidase N